MNDRNFKGIALRLGMIVVSLGALYLSYRVSYATWMWLEGTQGFSFEHASWMDLFKNGPSGFYESVMTMLLEVLAIASIGFVTLFTYLILGIVVNTVKWIRFGNPLQ